MGNGINNGMDSAVKFGAGRYRQGRGVLEHCGQEIRRFGKKAYIVSGPRAFDAVKDRLLPGLTEAGVEFVAEIYDGVCSYEAAEALGKKWRHHGLVKGSGWKSGSGRYQYPYLHCHLRRLYSHERHVYAPGSHEGQLEI